jgi:hypothetical protein
MLKPNLTQMGFTQELFPAGTHMCLLYSNENERKHIIGKYLESGLNAKEKVSYFADTKKPEDVRIWLKEMGIDPPEGNAFSILDAERTYCSTGEFVPEIMLNTLQEFYASAKKEDYPNARVSGEMSWALKGIPGSGRLMEYEAQVNDVLLTHPVSAICQYDVNRFSGASILDVLKVHPMMIVHGQIVQNPFFMKPEDFLKDFKGRR